MYDFISIACRFFIVLLLLGYLALAVAIFSGLMQLPIRRRVKKIFPGTLKGARKMFRLCADNLKGTELKSKSDAKGNYISQVSTERRITN